MGFIEDPAERIPEAVPVSVPLRGMGFIGEDNDNERKELEEFPSPYGAWVSSFMTLSTTRKGTRFRPLTGHGFHQIRLNDSELAMVGFRPLTGHGFHQC